jgi:hypothetical protein
MMVLVFVTVHGYELLRYALSSRSSTWGEVGVLPFVYGLRIVVARGGWCGPPRSSTGATC